MDKTGFIDIGAEEIRDTWGGFVRVSTLGSTPLSTGYGDG